MGMVQKRTIKIMSADKFSKHQKSKLKRYVLTRQDGKRFQADTQEELHKMNSDYEAEQINSNSVGSTKPKFDPDTGERIN